MKSHFKHITISIIVVLCMVFVVQLFWLRGLYNTIEAETKKNVLEAISIANAYELECRLDSIDKSGEQDKSKKTITVTQSFEDNKKDEPDKKNILTTKKEFQNGDTIETFEEQPNDDGFSIIQFEKFGVLFKETIHQALDSIAPIKLDTLHYYLSKEFETRGIKSRIFKIEAINSKENKIINSLNITKKDNNPFVFNLTYDSKNQHEYRIYIESLTRTVLEQMLGILSTTFIIIIVLCFAFWYLIRTILDQKNLEEMKEDFTNNMTHELKTPIAVAYSATDAMLNFGQAENKERREKYLTVCKDQLEKLNGLVEQILSMSMERRLKFILKKEDIELRGLLDNLVEQHKMKAPKEVNFSININPVNLIIYADKAHLNNLISNLIDNAIKYSQTKVDIEINAYQENQWNVIKIKDNGIGIASDKKKYIYDKFYRVPQGNLHNVKGYGIGLFYVKTVVEKHEGTIDLISNIGQGTEFIIRIPTNA